MTQRNKCAHSLLREQSYSFGCSYAYHNLRVTKDFESTGGMNHFSIINLEIADHFPLLCYDSIPPGGCKWATSKGDEETEVLRFKVDKHKASPGYR